MMKTLAYPILIALGAFVLVVFSAKILLDNISTLNAGLNDNKHTEEVLQTKFNSLKAISVSVPTDSQAALAALPATSPALTVMSMIRNQINNSANLKLNAFTAGEGVSASKALFSSDINMEAEGNYNDIATLINIVKTSAPIARFDSIRILNENSLGGSTYRFTADITSYWAPLPTSLPAVGQPFEPLSEDERKVLKEVTLLSGSLSGGNSVQVQAASPSAGRADPFSP